jgi:hypothetical protein
VRLKIALWLAYRIGGDDFRKWRQQRVRMGARLAEHQCWLKHGEGENK